MEKTGKDLGGSWEGLGKSGKDFGKDSRRTSERMGRIWEGLRKHTWKGPVVEGLQKDFGNMPGKPWERLGNNWGRTWEGLGKDFILERTSVQSLERTCDGLRKEDLGRNAERT